MRTESNGIYESARHSINTQETFLPNVFNTIPPSILQIRYLYYLYPIIFKQIFKCQHDVVSCKTNVVQQVSRTYPSSCFSLSLKNQPQLIL